MATSILTQDRVKTLLLYDPDTGVFRWKVARSNAARLSTAGTVCKKGYRRISIDAKTYPAHRLAWLYVYGVYPDTEMDHINRNRDDNRISNLRVANRFVNTQNTNGRKDNVSGHRGVGWHKISARWRARINVNNKCVNLGSFLSFEEAVAAYQQAAAKHHIYRT